MRKTFSTIALIIVSLTLATNGAAHDDSAVKQSLEYTKLEIDANKSGFRCMSGVSLQHCRNFLQRLEKNEALKYAVAYAKKHNITIFVSESFLIRPGWIVIDHRASDKSLVNFLAREQHHIFLK